MEETGEQVSVWQWYSAAQQQRLHIGHFLVTALFIVIGTVVLAFWSLATPSIFLRRSGQPRLFRLSGAYELVAGVE